jgi:hypothetical protein
VDADVEVDLEPIELAPGDRLLLNSDGLTAMVDADRVRQVLLDERDPQSAADRLVALANDAGGEDNVTVVVIDVGDDRDSEEDEEEPSRGREATAPDAVSPAGVRWGRALMITFLVLVLIGGGGFAAARYFLDNSYFVGANDAGQVTIYRGIPDEIAGLDLKTQEEETDIDLTDLPEFKREDVAAGIKVDSLDEAAATVANLETLARDFAESAGEKRPGDRSSTDKPSDKPTDRPTDKPSGEPSAKRSDDEPVG